MTLSREQALMQGRERLAAAGIADAAREARLLLTRMLDISMEMLVAHPSSPLSPEQETRWEQALERREKREPVSHILGTRHFWEDEFLVTRHTLDPRPDTETLIEAVCDLYPNRLEMLRIADIGTGTGCLLLTLLKIFPNAYGIGMDLSLDALAVAAENSKRLQLTQRASLIAGSWMEALHAPFDLIISNPPYIAYHESETLEAEVRLYEPSLALYGGEDGLDAYRALLPQAKHLLAPEGAIVLECGYRQAASVMEEGTRAGLRPIATRKDLAGHERCIIFKHP
jgi:release factor glutamine methyltransferase